MQSITEFEKENKERLEKQHQRLEKQHQEDVETHKLRMELLLYNFHEGAFKDFHTNTIFLKLSNNNMSHLERLMKDMLPVVPNHEWVTSHIDDVRFKSTYKVWFTSNYRDGVGVNITWLTPTKEFVRLSVPSHIVRVSNLCKYGTRGFVETESIHAAGMASREIRDIRIPTPIITSQLNKYKDNAWGTKDGVLSYYKEEKLIIDSELAEEIVNKLIGYSNGCNNS